MLTGDNHTTADAVAKAVGIDHVEAHVLPDRKAAVVSAFQQQGQRVAMAGDGINDAPALAQAEVGIAMGTGTDVAIESAGVTLVRGDLRGIVRARRLSRATMRNIRQNLFFAFILLLTATPLLGVVCEMDCDQPPATSSECHKSTASPGGPTVGGTQHRCDHDHTTGSPALLASTNTRDSVGSVIAIPVPTLAHASVTDARVAILAMHGPPGLSGRNTSFRITVLRI